MDERINQINEANEVMTIKLKHGEEFSNSFKTVMVNARIERQEQVVTLESYKEKLTETFSLARRELQKAMDDQKLETMKIRNIMNRQFGYN